MTKKGHRKYWPPEKCWNDVPKHTPLQNGLRWFTAWRVQCIVQ